jgi:uncharacterized protein YjbI with pentapeptide repeats
MPKNYSTRNLQKASFADEDLDHADFSFADLRGADFSGADLTAANFSHVKTGITALNTLLLFVGALAFSLLSGYVAMLAGQTVQQMLASNDNNIRIAGIMSLAVTVIFILFYYFKGGRRAITQLILPVVAVALVIVAIAYVSGLGTGQGMLFLILALILVVIMFFVGTIARSAAGSLSNILFILVALSGGMFGKSVGGGVGTVVMAISCAMISKRALSGAEGFVALTTVACYITRKFGTSFRNAKLAGADFSEAIIRNCDFSGVIMSSVQWDKFKKRNCINNGRIIVDKRVQKEKKTMTTIT